MDEPTVFLNGDYVPASHAAIPYFDKGIVMGATVTEMTRTYRRTLFRLDDHLDRLWDSLRYLGVDPGLTRSEFVTISNHLIAVNGALLPDGEELGLIHFVTAGKVGLYAGRPLSPREELPTVCIHTFPLDFRYYAEAMRTGYHLVTPSVRQLPVECVTPRIKHRSRIHWYLADRESRQVDPRATSLLLDAAGNITECSGANIFLVRQGVILTPSSDHVLPGVSRKVALELARHMGIPARETNLQVHDVVNADEAFLSSTPFGLCPASKINGLPIGQCVPGEVYRRLTSEWSRVVGIDIVAQITRVPG